MNEDSKQEKILFQYAMSYKAYRFEMITVRSVITLAAAGALAALCAVSVVLGIVLAAIAVFAGALSILLALGNEQNYTVYDARVVIAKRGADKRISVETSQIKKVAYTRSLFEKPFGVGTVTLYADKKYKLKHVFDARPVTDYIAERIRLRGE